ncbi:hypothetical protein JCM9492_16200 [Aquifex pyrophilus]
MLPFLLSLLLILSCGIKSSPKPLPEPIFTLKRIGDYVYVIGEDIEVKGFKKHKNFWYKKEERAFCFYVKHVKGKEKKACVPEAGRIKPRISYEEKEEKVIIRAEEKGIYNVYPYEGNLLIPFPLKTFEDSAELQKKYGDYEVGITKVINDVESQPVRLKIKRKPYPVPEPPYSAGYVISDGELILYWFHRDFENLKGFYVYKNGKKLNKEPIKRNVYVDRMPEERTIYKITAVNNFGVESEPVTVEVLPEKPRKP